MCEGRKLSEKLSSPFKGRIKHRTVNIMKEHQLQNMQMYSIVGIFGILVYLNSLPGHFVHDDLPAIVYNRDVLGTSSVFEVLLNDFWGMRMKLTDSHKSYRPLTTLTFRWVFHSPIFSLFILRLSFIENFSLLLLAIFKRWWTKFCVCMYRKFNAEINFIIIVEFSAISDLNIKYSNFFLSFFPLFFFCAIFYIVIWKIS